MSGRDSTAVSVGRWLQRLPLHWLQPLEWAILSLLGRREPWMIFIIAPPRSGSTVFYQALIHALGPIYLSNAWNALHRLPLLGGVLSRVKCRGHRSDFRSSRGFVAGLCGPAEGLRFWRHWFGHGISELDPDAGTAPPRGRARYIQRVLGFLSSPAKPFIAGYVGHALAVGDLRRLFPDAVFVRLRRDPVDNAMSILAIRDSLPRGAEFSVTPREWRRHRERGIHEEAAAQVWHINHRIDRALRADDAIEVAYEDLCRNPAEVMERVVEFCNERGFRLAVRGALPERLAADARRPHDGADVLRIRRILSDLDEQAEWKADQ